MRGKGAEKGVVMNDWVVRNGGRLIIAGAVVGGLLGFAIWLALNIWAS